MKKLFLFSILSVLGLSLGSTSNFLIDDNQFQITVISQAQGLIFISEVSESYSDLKNRFKFKTKSIFWTKLKSKHLLNLLVFNLNFQTLMGSLDFKKFKSIADYKIFLFGSNTSPPWLSI